MGLTSNRCARLVSSSSLLLLADDDGAAFSDVVVVEMIARCAQEEVKNCWAVLPLNEVGGEKAFVSIIDDAATSSHSSCRSAIILQIYGDGWVERDGMRVVDRCCFVRHLHFGLGPDR